MGAAGAHARETDGEVVTKYARTWGFRVQTRFDSTFFLQNLLLVRSSMEGDRFLAAQRRSMMVIWDARRSDRIGRRAEGQFNSFVEISTDFSTEFL